MLVVWVHSLSHVMGIFHVPKDPTLLLLDLWQDLFPQLMLQNKAFNSIQTFILDVTKPLKYVNRYEKMYSGTISMTAGIMGTNE